MSASKKTLYRTQSDTLKLQRLIEVLKERGSELGNSLETSASDLLTDVKPKTKDEKIPSTSDISFTSDKVEVSASTASSSSTCVATTTTLSASSTGENLPFARSTPPPPKVPPPPLPEETEMIPSMRRRGSALAKLGLDPEKRKKAVTFQEEEGGSSISQLVQKSSAVLRTLTLSFSENPDPVTTGDKPIEPQASTSLKPPTVELDSRCPEARSSSSEDKTKSGIEQNQRSPDVRIDHATPEKLETIKVIIESHDIEEDKSGVISEEVVPTEAVALPTDTKTEEESQESLESEPNSLFSKEDPPDPNELRRLPKRKRKQQTLAIQWRKNRERERSRSRENSPIVLSMLDCNKNSGANEDQNQNLLTLVKPEESGPRTETPPCDVIENAVSN